MHCCRGRLPLRSWQETLLLLFRIGPAVQQQNSVALCCSIAHPVSRSACMLSIIRCTPLKITSQQKSHSEVNVSHCLTASEIMLSTLYCCRSLRLIKRQLKMLLSLWSQCEKGGSSQSASMLSSQTCAEAELSTLNALWCGKASPAWDDAAVQF